LNDILDFSSMDAGRLTLHTDSFRLRDVFDSVSHAFQVTSAPRRLALSFDSAPEVPEFLVGDEARIRQILFNLVGNAIKFTLTGSVRVEAWSRAAGSSPGKVHLYVVVSDTGIGIPDEKVGYVFERFTQSDASCVRQYEGAGLGLAIVKRLVGLMDGNIAVDSEVGRGTSIYLHLPLGLPAVTTASAHVLAEASGDLAPLRILLAEDEAVSRLAMRTMLERAGHAVQAAGNGLEALQAVCNKDFDCVLMDIQMPEMDGVEATRHIRTLQEQSGRRRIPIIALTAYAMPGDREKFLAAGMDDYVSKPVQEEDLRRALRDVAGSLPLA